MSRRYSIIHVIKLCLFYSCIAVMAICTSIMQHESLYRYESSYGDALTTASVDDSVPFSTEDFSLNENPQVASETISNTNSDHPILASNNSTEGEEKLASATQAPSPAPMELNAEITVKQGDTIAALLKDHGIIAGEIHDLLNSLKPIYSPRKLNIGQKLHLEKSLSEDGQSIKTLTWVIDPLLSVEVKADPQKKFNIIMKEAELEKRAVRRSGNIHSTLTDSTSVAGVPMNVITTLTKAFSYDIDFQRDVHIADSFDIVFEQYYTKESGEFVRNGDLVYAALTLNDKQHTIFRHIHADGTATYYTKEGLGVRKSLLKTPINVGRVGDKFGPRKHPILGYTRMHRGVDFAAPRGTPIYAAGAGVVESMGYNPSYGNVIKVKHNEKFTTLYAHVHHFPRGLRKGDPVKQGQVIGYVGSSGLATGDHLHYEVHVYNRPVNPLNIKQEVSARLAGEELKRFRHNTAKLEKFLANAPKATSVALNDLITTR